MTVDAKIDPLYVCTVQQMTPEQKRLVLESQVRRLYSQNRIVQGSALPPEKLDECRDRLYMMATLLRRAEAQGIVEEAPGFLDFYPQTRGMAQEMIAVAQRALVLTYFPGRGITHESPVACETGYPLTF